MVGGTTENENESENEEAEYIFTAYEIDPDYEFDAPRFFDFSTEESSLLKEQAEDWFDSAGSYLPSPFVARLVWRERNLMENIKFSSNCEGMASMNLFANDYDCEVDHETSSMGMHNGGLTFYNQLVNNITSENQTKLSLRPTFPRNSTLMKPTASYLAKQSRPFHARDSRSNSSVLDKTSKSSTSSSVIENQAAKRQKLEGGLQRKVMGTVLLQQANLVHKAPKRDEYTTLIKPRITSPRDPNLETARRAQRAMGKSSAVENVTSTVHRFKALPLNRKILNTQPLIPKRSTPQPPNFQEFHLKTSKRAAQHTSSVLKSAVPWNHPVKELHKCSTELTIECVSTEPRSSDDCQSSHNIKTQPLNKKMLTSNDNIGAFQSRKKESTTPMEFNFQTEQRFHTIPPVELFNKLSLASETQSAANPGIKEP